MSKRNLPEPIWPFLVRVPPGREDLDLVVCGFVVLFGIYTLNVVVHGWQSWHFNQVSTGLFCATAAAAAHWFARHTVRRPAVVRLLACVIWGTAILSGFLDVILSRNVPQDVPYVVIPFGLLAAVLYTSLVLHSCKDTPPLAGLFVGLGAGFFAGWSIEEPSASLRLVMGFFFASSAGPLGLAVGAIARWKWRMRIEQRRNPVDTFMLTDPTICWSNASPERFWHIVFWLSFRDGASAISLGVTDGEGPHWTERAIDGPPAKAGDPELGYCVDGLWYLMVPPPRDVLGELQSRILKLAGIRNRFNWLSGRRRLTRRFLLGIDEQRIEAEVTLSRAGPGQRMTIRFQGSPETRAWALHTNPFEPPCADSGIGHVTNKASTTEAAVAAMLTSKPLEEITQVQPDNGPAYRYLPMRKIRNTLEAVTHQRWHVYKCLTYVPLTLPVFPANGAAVFVSRPWATNPRAGLAHWVFVRGDWVHDPTYRGQLSIGDYSRAGWAAAGIALPEPDR
jgi:hypothetical protein